MPLPFLYKEQLDSPRIKFSPGGGTATRRVHVRTDAILESWRVITAPIAEFPQMQIAGIEIEPIELYGWNEIEGWEGCNYKEVVIDYVTLFNDSDVPTIQTSTSCDYLETGRGRTFTTGGAPVLAPITMPVPIVDISISLTTYSDIPLGVGLPLMGMLNAAAWNLFDPGCVMYIGPETQRVFDIVAQNWKNRVTHKFRANPMSYLKTWNPDIQAMDTTDSSLGELADFSLLGDFGSLIS